MSDFEVRKVTTKRGETSNEGEHAVDVTTYDVGVTIDGTFVRIATVSEEQLHASQQRHESGYYGDAGDKQGGTASTSKSPK